MNDDKIKLVHAAVVAMITSPEFVDSLVRKILAVVPAQQADNSAMVPYECIHGIAINQDCSVCREFMGANRRVVAQHQ